MVGSSRVKSWSFKVATLWSLGEWWLGGIFASTLAIPFLLLLQSVFWLSQPLFYWSIALGAIIFLVLIQWALLHDPDKEPSVIVLDKIIGVMIAFAYVPLQWRIIVFGFIVFHILNKLRPFLPYRRIMRLLDRLPGVFGVLSGDILSGLLVNFFLQLIAWVMG